MTFLPTDEDGELVDHALVHFPNFYTFGEWQTLKDALVPYIGERAVSLFAFAIADASDCLNTAAYFRKELVDSGENVDNPQVTESEQLLVDWGRLIARAPNDIPEDIYERLTRTFNPRLRLILVSFAAQTIATNLLNTVGRIPLDEDLRQYRRSGDENSVS
jgi:hypothetical protein